MMLKWSAESIAAKFVSVRSCFRNGLQQVQATKIAEYTSYCSICSTCVQTCTVPFKADIMIIIFITIPITFTIIITIIISIIIAV